MAAVGLIVNPLAGKDIRRLVTAASHTSDSAKVDIVRRAVIAAAESGADRIVLTPDPHHLCRRAVADLSPGMALGSDGGIEVELLDIAVHGRRDDTVAAAIEMSKHDIGALIALGGDGTCRDVAIGWPDAPLIAMSTGTNNVFPSSVDATSAGAAAGFVATGAVDIDTVARRCKRIVFRIDPGDGSAPIDDIALVDLALIEATFVGSRAVLDPASVRAVLASFAHPSTTGLASIAGRLHPADRWVPGGMFIRLGSGGRTVRAPLSPGAFTTVAVTEVAALADGEVVTLRGPGVLAVDGERDRRIGNGAMVTASVESTGPRLIDVDATLVAAAALRLFDAAPRHDRPTSSGNPAGTSSGNPATSTNAHHLDPEERPWRPNS